MCEPEGAGVSMSMARLAIAVAIACVLATPAAAQVDLSGEWAARQHEDAARAWRRSGGR